MNNEAMWKSMGHHFTKNAASHRAQAACHTGLSACMKALGVDFTKGDKTDFHAELASQHNADAERCDKIAAACMKCAANKGADPEMVKAIAGAVLANVDEKFGKMVVPSSVKGAFMTADPLPVTLVNRQGGPSLPVPADAIDPAFRNLFAE
jgi:hypothetical protein